MQYESGREGQPWPTQDIQLALRGNVGMRRALDLELGKTPTVTYGKLRANTNALNF